VTVAVAASQTEGGVVEKALFDDALEEKILLEEEVVALTELLRELEGGGGQEVKASIETLESEISKLRGGCIEAIEQLRKRFVRRRAFNEWGLVVKDQRRVRAAISATFDGVLKNASPASRALLRMSTYFWIIQTARAKFEVTMEEMGEVRLEAQQLRRQLEGAQVANNALRGALKSREEARVAEVRVRAEGSRVGGGAE
jgi:hypothetical protein